MEKGFQMPNSHYSITISAWPISPAPDIRSEKIDEERTERFLTAAKTPLGAFISKAIHVEEMVLRSHIGISDIKQLPTGSNFVKELMTYMRRATDVLEIFDNLETAFGKVSISRTAHNLHITRNGLYARLHAVGLRQEDLLEYGATVELLMQSPVMRPTTQVISQILKSRAMTKHLRELAAQQ